VASTVNTLVLAYAGASLPLLLFFAQGSQPAGRLITGEVIAVEIVRMLVGSIGLVLSVPITTGLAALVLGPDDEVGHGHSHGGHGHGSHSHGEGEDRNPDDPGGPGPAPGRGDYDKAGTPGTTSLPAPGAGEARRAERSAVTYRR
jgi:hypothetical protein